MNAAVQDIFFTRHIVTRRSLGAGHHCDYLWIAIWLLVPPPLRHVLNLKCRCFAQKKLKLEGAMKLFRNIQDSFEANACKPKKSFVQSSIQLIHLGPSAQICTYLHIEQPGIRSISLEQVGQLRGNMWKSSGLI